MVYLGILFAKNTKMCSKPLVQRKLHKQNCMASGSVSTSITSVKDVLLCPYHNDVFMSHPNTLTNNTIGLLLVTREESDTWSIVFAMLMDGDFTSPV